MTASRRRFQRPAGIRRYRTRIVIATEGSKTEPAYFEIFKAALIKVGVELVRKSDKSSPVSVLKRMEAHLKENPLKEDDEAWLVIDKDRWETSQLELAFKWAEKKPNHHVALSNPKFEYWLLLHFEEGGGVRNSRDCSDRLKKHLPAYEKAISKRDFSLEKMEAAVRRAKSRHPRGRGDFRDAVGTTAYGLVEKLLDALRREKF